MVFGSSNNTHQVPRIALRDPAVEDDTLEMTYTFNSLFGDVQRHVIPTGSQEPLDSPPVDPLASAKVGVFEFYQWPITGWALRL